MITIIKNKIKNKKKIRSINQMSHTHTVFYNQNCIRLKKKGSSILKYENKLFYNHKGGDKTTFLR